MKSERTKQTGLIKNILFVLSWLCFVIAGVLVTLLIAGSSGGTIAAIQGLLGPVLWGYLVSIIIFIAMAVITKDKIKPLVWTANLILSNIVFGSTLMYVIFGLSLVDNYIVSPLYQTYKMKYITNKELDRRL